MKSKTINPAPLLPKKWYWIKIGFLLTFVLVEFFGFGLFSVNKAQATACTYPYNCPDVGDICTNGSCVSAGANYNFGCGSSSSNPNCPNGMTCVKADGLCEQSCNITSDCIYEGESCNQGRCTASGQPTNPSSTTIYACPSKETNPRWACDNANDSTCKNVSGCDAGTCKQIQSSQCGQLVSASPAPTTPATPPAGGQTANSVVALQNPIEKYNNLTDLLVNIMKGFLGIIAVWAVAFIVIGGFKMVVSAGNEEAVLSARKTITWAVLGLLVAVLSFAIVAIVQNLIGVNVPVPTSYNIQQKTKT